MTQLKSIVPLVAMLVGSRLGGVGTAVTGEIADLTTRAQSEFTALKSELDAGTAGPTIKAVMSLLPQVEAILELPPYNERQLFAALLAVVNDLHAAGLAV